MVITMHGIACMGAEPPRKHHRLAARAKRRPSALHRANASLLLGVSHLLVASALSPDAFICVQRTAVQPVQKVDAAVSLTDYMRLPVEQYCAIELPMAAKLTLASEVWPSRSQSNEFALRVPPLTFAIPGAPVAVEPLVYAQVDAQPCCVQIRADECTLSGSPFVESLRLNERFTFQVRTQLTWEDGDSPVMRAQSSIEADVEVPPLFAKVPRILLECIAAAAMSVVLQQLQRTFLRNLAADYFCWASDPAYREARSRQFGATH